MFGLSINHDSTAVLISSDETGIFNDYRIPLDGLAKQALTNSTDESIFVNSWFPETDEERLHNISHVFFGHYVKSPVFVFQGSNDP